MWQIISMTDSLHELIAELRREAALSQTAVATSLGVQQSAVSLWENSGLPATRNLAGFLNLVGATPEQRAKAWELHAFADAARKNAGQEAA